MSNWKAMLGSLSTARTYSNTCAGSGVCGSFGNRYEQEKPGWSLHRSKAENLRRKEENKESSRRLTSHSHSIILSQHLLIHLPQEFVH